MKLYHRTDAAAAILAGGFHDATGSYMFVGVTLTGVWLSLLPFDCSEGAKGHDLLEVTFPDDVDLSRYEISEEDAPPLYHEWCVPAALINEHAIVRLLNNDEIDTIEAQARDSGT